MKIGDRQIDASQPCYVIAEAGINHNGDPDLALELVRLAHASGCEAVKFQKRTPEICVPRDQWDTMRDTPWGRMKYIDYKHRIELDGDAYARIDALARQLGIHWFASCWDTEAVAFIDRYVPHAHKIASACITDAELLSAVAASGAPIIMSTGMSTTWQIDRAVERLDRHRRSGQLALLHTTSSYPCSPEEVNLSAMLPLRRFGLPVGYSGHERGIQITLGAVVLGACIVERHVTLDRTMWGTDHAASLEPQGIKTLVRDIRLIEKAMGDGVKRRYESEEDSMRRLRRFL